MIISSSQRNRQEFQKNSLKKYDFQIVERDYAFILDKDVKAGDLVSVIKKTNEIIKSVNVFDYMRVKILMKIKSL